MRFLLDPDDALTGSGLVDAGLRVRAFGLDGLFLRPTPDRPSPLVVAAAIAEAVPDILLAALVSVDDRHPVEIAEEAAVTDLACGGRLIAIAHAPTAPDDLAEAVDLLRLAGAARPFAFSGRRWTVPARLPENSTSHDEHVRVTPGPAGPRLELWTSGPTADVAATRGLGHLADEGADTPSLGERWTEAGRAAGVAGIGAPRARSVPWTDADGVVNELLLGRAAFGQDWAVIRGPRSIAADIGRLVRPRVQLEHLPSGLEDHWREYLHEVPLQAPVSGGGRSRTSPSPS